MEHASASFIVIGVRRREVPLAGEEEGEKGSTGTPRRGKVQGPPVLHTGRARIKGGGRRQAGDAGGNLRPACIRARVLLLPAPRRYRGDISATTAARLVPEITVDHHRGAAAGDAAAPPGRDPPCLSVGRPWSRCRIAPRPRRSERSAQPARQLSGEGEKDKMAGEGHIWRSSMVTSRPRPLIRHAPQWRDRARRESLPGGAFSSQAQSRGLATRPATVTP